MSQDFVSPWLNKGFEEEALKLIAKYCFTHNVKTFEGLNQTVEKFYKLGIVTADGIKQYVKSLIAEDGNIKQILDECRLVRMVSSSDRTMFKTWTKDWGFEFDLIKYAAGLSASASNPMTYLNKILSEFKANGVTAVEQAKAQSGKTKPVATTPVSGYPQHDYTKEQLNALFDNLEDL